VEGQRTVPAVPGLPGHLSVSVATGLHEAAGGRFGLPHRPGHPDFMKIRSPPFPAQPGRRPRDVRRPGAPARRSRVFGKMSRSADRKPGAPSPVAGSGGPGPAPRVAKRVARPYAFSRNPSMTARMFPAVSAGTGHRGPASAVAGRTGRGRPIRGGEAPGQVALTPCPVSVLVAPSP